MATAPSPNSFPYSGPPEQFDVTPEQQDAIPLADGEPSLWAAEHAAFIRSAAGLDNAKWTGVRPLGSGSFGIAGLWELRDENNVVIEQMVVKESKTVSVERWTRQVPEEVKMMRRMNNTNCQAVPKLIAYKRYMHVRKHRIYMEFCPHSDLTTLNLNYKRFRTYLPEPFLWHTFHNLVKVAAAMKNGPDDTNWDYQIVHRDLKPANIFLGLEDERSGFSSYPVAKTGDWGLATKVKHNDRDNPVGLRGAGTKAYYAPEQKILLQGDALRTQVHRHLDQTAPLPTLSAHTNVWGIGAIMFELLTHEAVVNYLEDDEWTENEALKHIPNARDPEYSGALTELIKLCLKPKPWDRPSVEELEIKIKTMCQSIVNEHAANPSLQEQDRLYYRGSEISQMPPGNWHYWRSLMEYVPRPSETPDRVGDPKNPFTNTIIYPHFPTSKIDGLDEDEEEEHSDDSDKGPDVDGAGEPVAALNDPSSSPNGNHADRPIVVSSTGNDADHAVVVSSTGNDADHAVVVSSTGNDADHAVVVSSTGNDADHPVVISDSSESNESHASHRSGDNRSSGGGSNSSNSSDDSETRRRMAIKTLPGA